MRRTLETLAVVWLLSGVAAAGQFGCPTCQACGGTCVLKASPVVEKETCYEVECKDVCIPAIRFPWDSCREPKCGRVRRVAVLKKESRETKACKYEWTVVCPRCGHIHPNGEASPSVPPAPAKSPPSKPPLPAPAVTNHDADAGFRLRREPPQERGQAIRLVGSESTRSITR